MKNKSKVLYLEMLRIVACFFVIFNHTGTRGFFLFSMQEPGSILFWLYLVISLFCEMSVPLFFMISGSILLNDKNYSLKKILLKILKTFIIMILFSIIYYFYDIFCMKKTIPLNLKTFLNVLLQAKNHLWFLYAYIKYLCFVPLLKMLVKNLQKKHFYYILILNVISQGFFVIFEYFLFSGEKVIDSSLRYLMTELTFVCPCIGYFIKNRLDVKNNKGIIIILWIASFLAIFIEAIMVNYQIKNVGIANFNENNGQTFNECFTIAIATTLFATFKYFFEHKKIQLVFEKIFRMLGSYTFGIYLIHPLAMYVISVYRIDYFFGNSMLGCFVYCFLVFMISACGVALFKLIFFLLNKLIKKIVKCNSK